MRNKLTKLLIACGAMFLLAGCGASLQPERPEGEITIDTPYEELQIPVEELAFVSSEKNLKINKGEKHTYVYEYAPSSSTPETSISWESGNEAVATVNDKGELTAVEGGSATIRVSSKISSNRAFETQTLNVTVLVPITEFNITETSLSLDYNETYVVEPTFVPANATNQNLTWSVDKPEICQVIDGVIKAGTQTGQAFVTVAHSDLGETHNKVIEVNVEDKTVHVESVSLSLPTDIELNDTGMAISTVIPNNAKEYLLNGVNYYVEPGCEDYLHIDSKTGEFRATALPVGVDELNVNVYAECEGIVSDPASIRIFKVTATGLSLLTDSKATINLLNTGVNTHQLAYEYTGISESGYDKPTLGSVVFSSDHEEIASVSEEGLITLRGSGTAVITIVNSANTTLTDYVTVKCTVEAESVSIVCEDIVYGGQTLAITSSVFPANTTDKTIEYTFVQSEVGLAVCTDNGDGTATIVANSTGIEGTVTITATNPASGVNATKIIDVTDEAVPFEANTVYVVGNRNYNPDSAVLGKQSWNDAKYAFKFTETTQNPVAKVEYKGTIAFAQGDVFKVRVGDTYRDPSDKFNDIGEYQDSEFTPNGAITKGQMSWNSDTNLVVNEAGTYDIYYAIYDRSHEEPAKGDWYSIYIEKTPEFSIDKTSINLNIGGNPATLTASHYGDSVTFTRNVDTFVDISVNKGVCTITPKAIGNTVITVTDSEGTQLTCTVQVTSAPVMQTYYLNANGVIENDCSLWLHAWVGGSNEMPYDAKFTKVAGKNLIWSAQIPEMYDSACIVRMPTDAEEVDWTTFYNKSMDVLITNSSDMFTAYEYQTDYSDPSHDLVIGRTGKYSSTENYTQMRLFHFNGTQEWFFTNCAVWVSAKDSTSNEWHWYKAATYEDNHYYAEAIMPYDVNTFLIVRCPTNTVVPDWNATGDNPGRIYNQTDDISTVMNQYSYSITNMKNHG